MTLNDFRAATAQVWRATVALARRLMRVMRATMGALTRHLHPKVMFVLNVIFVACAFIPGPLDELLMAAVVGALVSAMPKLRRDVVASVRIAWVAR